MLQILSTLFIFCIVLFLYLHIFYHLKTSNDLEIFEINRESKEKMEEIWNLRQPVLFDIEPEQANILSLTNKTNVFTNYSSYEIKIRENIYSFFDEDFHLYIPLSVSLANKLFDNDLHGNYYSENNSDFLEETGLKKQIQYYDGFLRPPFVCNCHYDILLGSQHTITPFRYNLHYRSFYMVSQGTLKIKLAPPKSSKYLHPVSDYENFEFRSPLNPWNIQDRFASDFEKVKCLELVLEPGKCFFIPAYWWYSFQFEKDTSVSCLYYRTYMSNISILPQVIMYTLQQQNIKHKTVKRLNTQNISNKHDSDGASVFTTNTSRQESVEKEELVKEEPENLVIHLDA